MHRHTEPTIEATTTPAKRVTVSADMTMTADLGIIARQLGRANLPGATPVQRATLEQASADAARAYLALAQLFGEERK